MSFSFAQPRRARRPNLMPMIDVVFLLLVFFMLAARFSVENILPIGLPNSDAADYTGPPRLVEIGPKAVMLNGQFIAQADLALAVAMLTESYDDAIVLRARPCADLSRVVAAVELLSAAGFTQLVLVE